MTEISLPEEAMAVIWRVFGAGASPLTERSAFDLIERIICKHVSSSTQQDWSISTMRAWFETSGQRHWLKSDIRKPVADLIFKGYRCRSIRDRNLGRGIDRSRLGSKHHSFSLAS